MKENKIWGETTLVWSGNNTETHRINIANGGYCSKHKHDFKYNFFYVEYGVLEIEVWKDVGVVDKTVLLAGESTTVAPGQYHRFTATEETSALEVYWVELKAPDIIREDHGGVLA
jgi:mannose-6-phosphate isomerase-like protein (cupin superfamily)